MPRTAFDQMRHTFDHKLDISSEWVILRRLATLSGVKPQYYDCCINSCMAYTEDYRILDRCEHCNEPRYHQNKPRRRFAYLPLIPRLQGFFQSETMIENLSYRSNYRHQPDHIRDVFDSANYHRLCQQNVVVDGVTRPYRYFSGEHDIALGLCTDGFLLFKRRRSGPSATPLLLQNYNLPPEMRILSGNPICLGVIPGPRPPVNIKSYLAPFDDELADLAIGIPTFNARDRKMFDMRAYLILKLGDILAIDKILGIKGVNAIVPCRTCTIRGVRKIQSRGTNYYVPLTTPHRQERPSFDPFDLPYRTHDSFDKVLQQIENAPTKKSREKIAKDHGIREAPALSRVRSLDHARSYPWEWFHLLLENIVPNLVKLWTGRFPGIEPGSDFEIDSQVWQVVGKETAEAVRDIPAAFVRVLGNISDHQSTFTAESWGFWFMYLAPHLLKDRFQHPKYYNHMLQLVNIMKTMLKFDITLEELDTLERSVICWVTTFER
jgi:hypothetical protein